MCHRSACHRGSWAQPFLAAAASATCRSAAAGLSFGTNFAALDTRLAQFMARSHVLFVRNEYHRRAENFSEKAREVVAAGMETGLGRKDIAANLAKAAADALTKKNVPYWELVAGAFVGRGRSYAQVGAYADAGITHYRIEAVLDERTSNICRFLHGRVFSVRDSSRLFEEAGRLQDPEDIKNLSPWPREDAAGLYIMRGGRRIHVARIERSGAGASDDVGELTTYHSQADLARLGLGFPPFHGLCRSTTVPA